MKQENLRKGTINPKSNKLNEDMDNLNITYQNNNIINNEFDGSSN
jgi:hypothetical protein